MPRPEFNTPTKPEHLSKNCDERTSLTQIEHHNHNAKKSSDLPLLRTLFGEKSNPDDKLMAAILSFMMLLRFPAFFCSLSSLNLAELVRLGTLIITLAGQFFASLLAPTLLWLLMGLSWSGSRGF
uniref:Uncharacterized protein n=1 Tax=Opuntia streptacantha TaxID=393608 RepID=A0A7C8Z4J6_OPUST